MQEKDFYIGWQDEAPGGFRKTGRNFFIGTIVVTIIFALVYVPSQQSFDNSVFEYGRLTELSGTLVNYPVYGLKTKIDGLNVTVPLVGFGKAGVEAVSKNLISQLEGEISEYEIKLRGTLIKRNAKTWMELTEGAESIISKTKLPKGTRYIQKTTVIGDQEITGEIVDPKCFFGVMKPGFGKIHRSCAIRCISGGIPPVLAVKEGNEYVDFYFITDQEGNQLNKQLLQFVGKRVTVKGATEQIDDWKSIKIKGSKINSLVSLNLKQNITSCY